MLNALLEVLYRALSCPELALEGLSLPGSCLPSLLSFLGGCPAQLPGLLQLLLCSGSLLLRFSQALLQPCFLLLQLLYNTCGVNSLRASKVFLVGKAPTMDTCIHAKSAQGLHM